MLALNRIRRTCTYIIAATMAFISQPILAQVKLHVGEVEFLEIPDPPYDGIINHSNWTAGPGVAIEDGDNTYGAIVKVTRYYTGSVSVNASYSFYYYDSNWNMRVSHSSKTWSVSCIPIAVSMDCGKELVVDVGKSVKINTSYPSSANGWMFGIEYKWDVEDPSVISLTPNSTKRIATVKGLKTGATTITLDPIVGPPIMCYVSVVAPEPPKEIKVNPETLAVKKGNTGVLKCVFYPEGSGAKVSWRSSDESIAKVDASGNVTAVEEGTCTVTASTDNGLSASATVNVVSGPKSISISGPTAITVGYNATLVADIKPEGATSELKWTSSDPHVVRVLRNGRIKGMAPGKATITVKTENDLTDTFTVSVLEADEDLSRMKAAIRLRYLKQLVNRVQ